jgi:hypothetical protein
LGMTFDMMGFVNWEDKERGLEDVEGNDLWQFNLNIFMLSDYEQKEDRYTN